MTKTFKSLALVAITTLLMGAMASCSSEDEKKGLEFKTPGQDSVALFHNDTHQLEFNGRDGSALVITVKDTLVAKISPEGMITAGLVGKTQYTITQGSSTLKGIIEVKPRYTSFAEPLYEPKSTTRKAVFDYEKREYKYSMPFGETDSLIVFKDKTEGLANALYIYHTPKDYMKQAIITFKTAEAFKKHNVVEFLKERYPFVGYSKVLTDVDEKPAPMFQKGKKIIKAAVSMGQPAIFYQDVDEENKGQE